MASVLANSDATLLDRGSNLELEVAVSILNSGYKPLDTPSWLGDLRERISALIFLKATMERKSTAKKDAGNLHSRDVVYDWLRWRNYGSDESPTNFESCAGHHRDHSVFYGCRFNGHARHNNRLGIHFQFGSSMERRTNCHHI
jgi:hypothetical protein